MHTLLRTFDALVALHRGRPSGLHGSIVVHVIGGAWWRLELEPVIATQFHASEPPEADVSIVLSDEAASALLRTGEIPATDVTVRGDGGVLEAFMEKYAATRSPLDIRSQR